MRRSGRWRWRRWPWWLGRRGGGGSESGGGDVDDGEGIATYLISDGVCGRVIWLYRLYAASYLTTRNAIPTYSQLQQALLERKAIVHTRKSSTLLPAVEPTYPNPRPIAEE